MRPAAARGGGRWRVDEGRCATSCLLWGKSAVTGGLQFEQFGVTAAGGHELFVRAARFQAAFVDGFRVAVEEVADRGGGGVHRALRLLRPSRVRGAEEKNRVTAMSAAHPEEGGSEAALGRAADQALRPASMPDLTAPSM